jgi:ABC-2 type transport system permease protein
MLAMLKKEIKEIFRTYRWLLLPCVFIFLGLAQPLSYKLMPALLQNANTPGITISITALPSPEQVLASVFGQYSQMGILMIILLVMGTVAQEKNTGAAVAVLVKPISRASYLGAKTVAYTLLTTVSFTLGMVATGYYTNILIGGFSVGSVALGGLVYLVYLLVAVALTVLTSTIFNSQVAAGGSALLGLMALTLLPKLGVYSKEIFPGALVDQAIKIITLHSGEPLKALLFNLILILIMLCAAWYSLNNQEL